MRKRTAQSGTILSQFRAQLFAERSKLEGKVSVNEIPRKSAVFSALMRKTMVKHAKYLAIGRKTFWPRNGPTRVKSRSITQTGRNARFVFTEIPERAVNKGLFEANHAANAPHMES